MAAKKKKSAIKFRKAQGKNISANEKLEKDRKTRKGAQKKPCLRFLVFYYIIQTIAPLQSIIVDILLRGRQSLPPNSYKA